MRRQRSGASGAPPPDPNAKPGELGGVCNDGQCFPPFLCDRAIDRCTKDPNADAEASSSGGSSGTSSGASSGGSSGVASSSGGTSDASNPCAYTANASDPIACPGTAPCASNACCVQVANNMCAPTGGCPSQKFEVAEWSKTVCAADCTTVNGVDLCRTDNDCAPSRPTCRQLALKTNAGNFALGMCQ